MFPQEGKARDPHPGDGICACVNRAVDMASPPIPLTRCKESTGILV